MKQKALDFIKNNPSLAIAFSGFFSIAIGTEFHSAFFVVMGIGVVVLSVAKAAAAA